MTTIRYYNGNRYVINRYSRLYITCQHGTYGWHGRFGEHTTTYRKA